jgi:hypothetical protein
VILKNRYFIVIALCILAGIFGLFFPFFFHYLSGSNLSALSAVVPQYLTGIVWALLLAVVIFVVPVEERAVLLGLWIFRCVLTLGVMIFYEKTYALDAFMYYKDAINENFYFSWSEFHGTSNTTALLWLLNNILPFFSSYHALKVFFSFIGLWGIYFFYLSYKHYFRANIRLLWVLGIFPSLAFWSSIIGKDPISMFGLGIFTYGCVKSLKEVNARAVGYIVIGSLILSYIRFWLPLIFIIPLFISMLVTMRAQFDGYRIVGMLVIGFVAYALYGFFMENVQLQSITDTYDRLNVVSRAWSVGGSSLAAPSFHNWVDIVKFIPTGMFTSLFRPLPGEVSNFFGAFAGVESLLLLILTTRTMIFRQAQEVQTKMFIYLISTVCIWSAIYGFISYQNLGTAVRFKIQILPFLILLIFLASDKSTPPVINESKSDLKK